jgi:formate dehydrogenase gamma subunit
MVIQDTHPPNIDDRELVTSGLHDRIERFGVTERLLHWWIVTMFASALLSGIALGDEAESGSVLNFHIGSVILIGIGIVFALVFGNTMAVLRSAKDLLIFDRTDVSFVLNAFSHPSRRSHVRWGKFNIGQKVLAWSLIASVAAVVITGINSWSSGEGASGPHAAAVLLTLALLTAHVFMAVINPSTRPALPGMIFGHVRRSWANENHAAWLEKADRKRPATR